jgi:hypothetical protein
MTAKKKSRSEYARGVAKLKRAFAKSRTSALKRIKATCVALEASRSGFGRHLLTDRERAVFNAVLFISLHSHDMAVFTEDMAATRLRSRKLVYARVFATHCAGFFNDVPALIKATMHSDAVEAAEDEAQKVLLAAVRLLRPIRRKYAPMLEFIRNNALAHREHDALKQHEIIQSIKVKEMIELATDIYKWQSVLVKSFLPVVKRFGEQLPKRSQLLAERIKASKLH